MNRRLSTTISPKHWELLKKHIEKYETQQKVLEAALESLENNRHNSVLSIEEERWMRVYREVKTVVITHKDILESLVETADIQKVIDVINNHKMTEFMMSWLYMKPLYSCTIIEILDGILFFLRTGNMNDMSCYSDDGDHYTLKLVHNLNLNNSKIFKAMIESTFKAYGSRTESEISDKSLFVKVYKI